jgi:hypothetical protein
LDSNNENRPDSTAINCILTVHDKSKNQLVTLPLDAETGALLMKLTQQLPIDLANDVTGVLPVANGGTGLSSGTSGGVPYFNSGTTMATSGALAQNQLVLGGGAGAAPATLGSLGTSSTLLHGNAGGAPSFAAVALASDVSGTLPIANGGTGQTGATAAFDALAPTTTAGDTMYHNGTDNVRLAANGTGNNKWLRSVSSGNPSWQEIVCADVTGLGTGGVLYGLAGSGTALAIGSAGQVLAVNSGATAPEWQTPSSSSASAINYVVNGGFALAQRQTPGTDRTISDSFCGPDRFNVWRENTNVQYSRQDGTGESGIKSRYFGRFTKITTTGKFYISQLFEHRLGIPWRGNTMHFQLKMKASSTKTIRIGIVELNSSGTADTFPATHISAYGANSTDPTLGTNLARCTVTAGTNTTISGSGGSCSVTTSWQTFSINCAMPSNSKNYVIAIWTDSQFVAADTLSLAEVDFFPGSVDRTWYERHEAQETNLAQRFFEKSFELEIAPAHNLSDFENVVLKHSSGTAANSLQTFVMFRVRKRAVSTIVTYNTSATNANWRDITAGADVVVSVANISDAGVGISNSGATVDNNRNCIHWTADAEFYPGISP